VADEEMHSIFVVQERLIVRARAVHRIQVEARGSEIEQGVGIVVALQLGRRIEGEVVIGELPEVGEARGNVRIVAGRVFGPRRRLRLHHLAGQLSERGIGWQERRQVAEHSPEPALTQGGSRDEVQAAEHGPVKRFLRHAGQESKA
jgi:hypothetical protein